MPVGLRPPRHTRWCRALERDLAQPDSLAIETTEVDPTMVLRTPTEQLGARVTFHALEGFPMLAGFGQSAHFTSGLTVVAPVAHVARFILDQAPVLASWTTTAGSGMAFAHVPML